MSDTSHDDERTAGKPAGGAPGAQPENWLTAVVLLILRDWSSYGYDLMRRLAAFGFAAMNYGTLYRVLRQLEKDGMVSSAWDTSKSGPARRIYAITEAGEAYLKLWAGSLEQYRTMMDAFFRLYGVVPPRMPGQERADVPRASEAPKGTPKGK
jgi:poly-beta-hydroxybutyrate-responsive repressor